MLHQLVAARISCSSKCLVKLPSRLPHCEQLYSCEQPLDSIPDSSAAAQALSAQLSISGSSSQDTVTCCTRIHSNNTAGISASPLDHASHACWQLQQQCFQHLSCIHYRLAGPSTPSSPGTPANLVRGHQLLGSSQFCLTLVVQPPNSTLIGFQPDSLRACWGVPCQGPLGPANRMAAGSVLWILAMVDGAQQAKAAGRIRTPVHAHIAF